jgi:DNA-binding response OmpR family regulator
MVEDILVVEDEALTRRELAQTLRNEGYEVTEAADGAEAVQLLDKRRFKLIISDFVLPKFHGFDLVRLIHANWPKMPIIVISGYLSEAGGKVILEGLADFMQKPVNTDILVARVRRFLRS